MGVLESYDDGYASFSLGNYPTSYVDDGDRYGELGRAIDPFSVELCETNLPDFWSRVYKWNQLSKAIA